MLKVRGFSKLDLCALRRLLSTQAHGHEEKKVVIRPGGRASASGLVVTVFGSSGYLARFVVAALGRIGSQVICPYRGDGMDIRHLKLCGELGQIVPLPFDLFDTDSIMRAISRSNVVVNLISNSFETRNYNFHDTHVKAAHRLARLAKESGVTKFIQVSALGANHRSESQFYKSKAEGEDAVRDYFPDAVILRPAPVFGEVDHFIAHLQTLILRPLVRVPVINNGNQLIQPAFVKDVANAIVNSITLDEPMGKTFHLGGPEIWTLASIIDAIREWTYIVDIDKKHADVPFPLAKLMGRLREYHPVPRFKRFYDADWFVRQQYNCVVPSQYGTLTFKDLHITELTPLFPMLVDICRPRAKEASPVAFGVEKQREVDMF